MLKRLAKLITNNFWLKVLAVVFAVILWMIVVNVEDPDKPVSFSIPVEVINDEVLTDMGKTYEILDDTDNISFTVTGKRSIVETLTADDFMAVANFENIDDSLSMVPIVITATSYSSQLEITRRNSYLMLNVENLSTKELEIEVDMDGEPASGCFADTFEVNPQTVVVSGPESAMEQVDSAKVTLDVNGADDSVSSTEEVIILDEDGKEADMDRLTLDASKAIVSVDIQMRKTVPLAFEVIGEPADGCRYNEVTCETEAVDLIGKADILNAMEELNIISPLLNIEGASETITTVIRLDDFLPNGISLADGEETSVIVTMDIESEETVEVEIPSENITVENMPDGWTLHFDDDIVIVSVTGYEDDVSDINGSRLRGTLDAGNLEPGVNNVSIDIRSGYGSELDVTATLILDGGVIRQASRYDTAADIAQDEISETD